VILFEVKQPLVDAVFRRRISRFMAEVQVGDEIVTAHIGNSGRLSDVLIPGAPALLKTVTRPGRKSRFDMIAVKPRGSWILVDTHMHGDIAEKIVDYELVPELSGYEILKREVKVGSLKIDFLLKKEDTLCYMEVKGCTHLKSGNVGVFPDAPTIRGRRHVKYLLKAVKEGIVATITFLVFREEAESFSPNWDVDPEFSHLLKTAYEDGVLIVACKILFDGRRVCFEKTLPINLDEQK